MSSLLTALVIISAAIPSAPEIDPLLVPPAELEWPPDLPRRHFVPAGKLIPADTQLNPRWVPTGRLLPSELADHVDDRLEYLDAQPALCGKKLQLLDGARRVEMVTAVDTCEAVARTRLTAAASDDGGYSGLQVFGFSVGALTVGVLTGILIGVAAGG